MFRQVKKDMPGLSESAYRREAARRLGTDYDTYLKAWKKPVAGVQKSVEAKVERAAVGSYRDRWKVSETDTLYPVYEWGDHSIRFADIRVTAEEQRAIIQAIDDIMQRMPNTHLVAGIQRYTWLYYDMKEAGTYGATSLRGYTISLNSAELRKARWSAKDRSYFMPSAADVDRIAYTIAHEYGHTLEWHLPTENSPRMAANRVKMDGHSTAVSEYGMESEHEAFAEMFAEWYLTGGKSTNPAVVEFAKRFGWSFGG
jgi:hypothetical protein